MSNKSSIPDRVQDVLQTAEQLWPGRIDSIRQEQLLALIIQHRFSLSAGDLTLIDRKWYVTHAGLLRIARRNRCNGIQTEVVPTLSDPPSNRWVVKATVYKSSKSKGFVGYGDADPGNVSELVRGAELRIAETRAVNRALRKAYGIGLCSVEEIGTATEQAHPHRNGHNDSNEQNQNGHAAQPSRLRDRLLLVIRQHNLDAAQVKGFAEAFCGNKPLREAKRTEVEAFLQHLTQLLSENRQRALELLSRYAPVNGKGTTLEDAEANPSNKEDAA